MKTIKKIYKEFEKTFSKKRVYYVFLITFLFSTLVIIEPMFFSELIKQIENYLKTGYFDKNYFISIIIFWIIFNITFIFLAFYHRFHIADIHALRNHNRVFSSKIGELLTMKYGYYLGKRTGSIYKNFDRGLGSQFESIFFFLKDFLSSCIQIILIIILLLFIDIKLTLISLSLLPVMIILGIYYNKKTIDKQNELNKNYDKIFGNIGDYFNNFLLSKTLRLEKYFEEEENKLLDKTYDIQYSISKRWSIVNIYTTVIVNLSRLILLGFGTYFVINGSLEFYKLFLFYAYINYVYFPLGFIFGSLQRIQKIISEADNFYKEFENMDTENLDLGEDIKEVNGDIEFKGVSFSYIKGRNILKNMSFSIKKGEKIAFVGNTGAGKSTIINLILRFWDTDSGEIFIDGKNIKDISKNSLRKHIGIVTQDISLFNDTLRQNLLYAKQDAKEEELFDALDKAEASFVKKLENGLDTIIGERGLKLSGGEKQRIAIARLFLKNPEILILDEATSALDNKTEKLVQKALDKLMEGKTSIIIAHRLSTIQNSDKIFFLESGEIKEIGNYNELMTKNGKFAELANPKNLIVN
ncbi:hypothetical protein DLH72_01160 [Candidatus Gracilibacteria bacterium]|nr:MAG: hypothetical protein DLH72_01160 [Candidatus Gracilibacteria bacterium]